MTLDLSKVNQILEESYMTLIQDALGKGPFWLTPEEREEGRRKREAASLWAQKHPRRAAIRRRRSDLRWWWADHVKGAWDVLRHGEQDYGQW